MSPGIANVEITLRVGDLRLRTSPYVASLRGTWRERQDGQQEDIISGYSGATNKVGGQGDVLIPFPGRIRDGVILSPDRRTSCFSTTETVLTPFMDFCAPFQGRLRNSP